MALDTRPSLVLPQLDAGAATESVLLAPVRWERRELTLAIRPLGVAGLGEGAAGSRIAVPRECEITRAPIAFAKIGRHAGPSPASLGAGSFANCTASAMGASQCSRRIVHPSRVGRRSPGASSNAPIMTSAIASDRWNTRDPQAGQKLRPLKTRA